jgi:hypothetical protein
MSFSNMWQRAPLRLVEPRGRFSETGSADDGIFLHGFLERGA